MIKVGSNVYFAKCVSIDGIDLNVVKVGVASNSEKRVAALGAMQPFRCELICETTGDMFMEYFVHMWLRKQSVGGEYFRRDAEVDRIINCVLNTGKTPFPITFVENEGMFVELDCVSYMEARGITFADITKHSGVSTNNYRKLLEREKCGNRRFLAALAVTAVRMGHSIKWSRDFKPPKTQKIAA